MEAVLLRVEEVAKSLKCSRSEVYRLMNQGSLPQIRIGATNRGVRIPAKALEDWVAERLKRGNEWE